MSKVLSINVRVSRQEKEIMRNNAKASGFEELSDYIRLRGLSLQTWEEKLNKIYEKLFPEDICKNKLGEEDKKLAEFI